MFSSHRVSVVLPVSSPMTTSCFSLPFATLVGSIIFSTITRSVALSYWHNIGLLRVFLSLIWNSVSFDSSSTV